MDEEDDTFVYRDAEVRNQRFCAVGIINDPDKSLNESMLAIYAGFETEEICIRYIEDTLADDEENMHLYCVDMYQWLYPTLTDNRGLMSEIPQTYRHDELNNWINGKKNQDAMIKKIKDTAEAHKNSKKQSESVGDDVVGERISLKFVPCFNIWKMIMYFKSIFVNVFDNFFNGTMSLKKFQRSHRSYVTNSAAVIAPR